MGLLLKRVRAELMAFIRGNFIYSKSASSAAPALTPGRKPRIEFVDLAKGICILMVVAFHSPRVDIDLPGVAAMRMPLYFILSGLFFKNYGGMRQLAEKKINKIIIPFLFFIILDIAFQAIGHGRFDWHQFLYPATDGQHLHNIPVWFLCSLFFANLIFCGITLMFRSKRAVAIAVGAVGGGGLILTSTHTYLPFYITQALNGLPFFYLGYILRSTPILVANKFDRFNLPICAFLLLAAAGICIAVGDTPRLDFFQNHFNGHPLLFYPVALIMVAALLMLCKAIKWLPIVSYIGRYSIVVLGLHQLLLFQLRWAKVPFTEHKLMGWSLFGAVVAICWIAIPFMTKLLPGLTAQTDWFRLPTISSFAHKFKHLPRPE